MHYVAIISIWGFGVVQLVVGFMGIQFHLGVIWAAIALLAALVFRFTLPITIGSFFGAMSVWGWHWGFAALFAVPGLIFLIPGVILTLIGAGRK